MQSIRLKPLHVTAQRKEDAAVQRYLERQQQLQRHETRLAELEAYLSEYSRPPARSQSGVQLRMRREFIDRLRGIVRIEANAVEQARAACEAERARWLLAHRSTEVLDKLGAHYRAHEARVEDRRLQRESDEIATQRWRVQRSPPAS